MSKDQGNFGMNNQESLGQGNFGEQHNGLGESWICPECETINTESKCVLCGYEKSTGNGTSISGKKWKKLLIICSVLLCVIAGITELVLLTTNDAVENTTVVSEESNILMNDSNEDTDTIFGSDYLKSKIGTIIFLDTIKDAPEDSWDVSAAQDRSVLAWVEADTYALEESNNLYIGAEGRVIAPANSDYLFAQYTGLRTIDFNNVLSTENVSSMRGLFQNCDRIRELDLTSWDTGSVTDMSDMFNGCSSATMSVNFDMIDTSEVTDMSHMFSGCVGMKDLDLSSFNTSKVKSMKGMFYNCRNLTALDLSNFDTANVTNMSRMFGFCEGISFLDLSSFNTSRVTDMSEMFSCVLHIEYPDGFSPVPSITGTIIRGTSSLTTLNISSFDTSNVTDMRNMFSGCTKLETFDLSGFDISKVEQYEGFMDCGKTINGHPWETLFE